MCGYSRGGIRWGAEWVRSFQRRDIERMYLKYCRMKWGHREGANGFGDSARARAESFPLKDYFKFVQLLVERGSHSLYPNKEWKEKPMRRPIISLVSHHLYARSQLPRTYVSAIYNLHFIWRGGWWRCADSSLSWRNKKAYSPSPTESNEEAMWRRMPYLLWLDH